MGTGSTGLPVGQTKSAAVLVVLFWVFFFIK
jgi:hypothetical protein